MPHRAQSRVGRALSAFGGILLSMALLLTAFAVSAKADGFKIVRLVDGMNRSDLPCPPCTPFYIFYTPVISGDRVAFLSRNGPPDGIWSGVVATKALTKLAGLDTPVPGASGNFSAFFGGTENPITIGGGTVAFFGADAVGVLGLFTVPVGGGPLKKIATLNTIAPDGTKFTDIRRASTNGSNVVFYARTPDHFTGIYEATIFGRNLHTVIDDGTLLDARRDDGTSIIDYFGNYGSPVIGKTSVNFYAGGVFDPSSGPNAIFQGQLGGYLDIADNATHLQGGTVAKHVRITAFSAAVGSNAVAFRADQDTGFIGIFKSRGLSYATAFVTTKSLVPGTARKFLTFYGF